MEITRRDLRTLKHGEWLNDNVITFYFHLIAERSGYSSKLPKVCAFLEVLFEVMLSGLSIQHFLLHCSHW
jgi:Ulp1 family protease